MCRHPVPPPAASTASSCSPPPPGPGTSARPRRSSAPWSPPDACSEVRHVDILQYTSKLFRRVYAQAYLDLVNRAPEVLGWLYDYFDEPWKHERLRLALDKLNTTRFVRLLERERPDWAVSTHFLPAEIIAWLRSKDGSPPGRRSW